MLKAILVFGIAATLAVGILHADKSTAKATSPENPTDVIKGKQMYGHYCSPCHGTDGKGYGPVVTAQKAPPIDLTVMSKNNHGRFPQTHVIHVLQHGTDIPSHTSVEMPVWGPVLGKINQNEPKDRMARVTSLSQYLEAIQAK